MRESLSIPLARHVRSYPPCFSPFSRVTGEILAKDLDCSFEEVAASEQVTQVAEVFHEVRAAEGGKTQSLLFILT